MASASYLRRLGIGALLIAASSLMPCLQCLATSASAARNSSSVSSSPSLARIFYYREGKKARASLFAHASSIDVLAPQAYSIDGTGALEGSIDPAVIAFAKQQGIRLMPLVTNKAFASTSVASFLDDPAKQDAAIAALVSEAASQGYWGWQADFEQIDVAYRDKFSAFIARAGQAMKTHGLEWSVAVVAQTSENPADYPKDLWNKLIGAYDYYSLASSADFVTVMSYDDPESSGPVARYAWLNQVLDYSLSQIPASKLSLGLSLYYWKWNDRTGKLVGIGGYSGMKAVLKRKGITLGYSSAEQAPFIKYKIRKNSYTLWYENARSVAQKIALIKQRGLLGFSAWTLGLEVPSVFKAIGTM